MTFDLFFDKIALRNIKRNNTERETIMTTEEILKDIRSDRVKKVIHDSDMGIEMDDQYALAYCIGCEKTELLACTAATFGKGAAGDYAWGMEESYKEILRVLNVCGVADKYPAYRGPIRPMGIADPVDSEAVRAIIDIVSGSDEIIYILATGCCTNIVSACLIEPSIKEKLCVIWLGGTCLDTDEKLADECNLAWDFRAGQQLLELDIPLVLLPAYDHGTVVLDITLDTLKAIKGDSPHAVFFRETLPGEYDDEPYYVNGWERVLFDVAAPAVLARPDAFEFKIIPAPMITDSGRYAFSSARHSIIYMESLNPEIVLEDTWRCINNI